MSTAYETVAQTRPRMRHDVLFTRTEDGVLFHNASSGFRLSSGTAYRLAALLVPHLNGRNRVADICRPLPPAQRDMIGELVDALYGRGFARDVPVEEDPETVLDPAVAGAFAAQVAYVDHYVTGPRTASPPSATPGWRCSATVPSPGPAPPPCCATAPPG